MRNLMVVVAALAAILAIVSGNLWLELRSNRGKIADLQEQLDQAQASAAELSQALARRPAFPMLPRPVSPPAPTAAPPVVVAAAPPPPIPVADPSVPVTPPPVVSASVRNPLMTGTDDERRINALAQSAGTATARVGAWSGALTARGQALTPEQLQTFNTVAIAELRRETEESLEIDSRAAPMDAQAIARLREETINRQHDTNMRILEKMTPHLNQDQVNTLRTMYESWIAAQLARLRATQRQGATAF